MKGFTKLLRMGLAAALLAGAGGALADDHDGDRDHDGHDRGGGDHAFHVPEFDAAALGVVSAVLVGGGILLARRRRR